MMTEIYVPNALDVGCKVNVWINGKNSGVFYDSHEEAIRATNVKELTKTRVAWDGKGIYYIYS